MARCKMGIVADACVDVELVHVAKADEMYPQVSNSKMDVYLLGTDP